MLAILSAEFQRSRHSASERLVIFGFLISLIQILGWLTVANGQSQTWSTLLAWQGVFVTGFAAPVAALLAALTQRREFNNREGGTLWRVVSPSRIRSARLVLLAGQWGALIACLMLPIILLALAFQLPAEPIGKVVLSSIYLWLTLLPLLPLGYLLSRWLGIYLTIGLFFIWQIAGTLTAETAYWFYQPWTYSVRAVLPLLKVHANLVPAEAGEAILASNPLWPLVGALGWGVLSLALYHFCPRSLEFGRGRPKRNFAPPADPNPGRLSPSTQMAAPETSRLLPGRYPKAPARPVSALRASLRHTHLWIGPLSAIVLLSCMAPIYPATYLRGMAGLVVIPFGAALLAGVVWNIQQPALRLTLTRISPMRLAASIGLVTATIMGAVVLFSACLLAGKGQNGIAFALVGGLSGCALLALDLLCVSRGGLGTLLAVTLTGVVVSAIFGSEYYLHSPIWVVTLWGYAYAARTTLRVVIAAAISLLLAASCFYFWVKGIRQQA